MFVDVRLRVRVDVMDKTVASKVIYVRGPGSGWSWMSNIP